MKTLSNSSEFECFVFLATIVNDFHKIFRGVCTQAPVFGIVMEFCPYGPLNQVIQEGSKVITTSRVVSWSKQIAVGMQYLHHHKIIHRDLKSPK